MTTTDSTSNGDPNAITSQLPAGLLADVARLAAVKDVAAATEAYVEGMRHAYWQEKDLSRALAYAYAGISHLFGVDDGVQETVYEARSGAKALMYDIASFTWTGWDEQGIDVTPPQEAEGFHAARGNLAMAIELDKGALPLSRACWMLGAHELTAGVPLAAVESFVRAQDHASKAGSDVDVELSMAFECLARVESGDKAALIALSESLETLAGFEHGEALVAQVTTAGLVLGHDLGT